MHTTIKIAVASSTPEEYASKDLLIKYDEYCRRMYHYNACMKYYEYVITTPLTWANCKWLRSFVLDVIELLPPTYAFRDEVANMGTVLSCLNEEEILKYFRKVKIPLQDAFESSMHVYMVSNTLAFRNGVAYTVQYDGHVEAHDQFGGLAQSMIIDEEDEYEVAEEEN